MGNPDSYIHFWTTNDHSGKETEHMMRSVLRGARIVTADGVRDGCEVTIRDGLVESLDALGVGRSASAEDVVRAEGLYLLPGFIDVHAHGAGGFEFTAGGFDPKLGRFDASEDAWRRGLPAYSRFLARTGVTTAVAATWAAPVEHLARVFDRLGDYIRSGRNGEEGARLLGGNLEGTFINPRMAGAQNPAFTLDPSHAAFDAINRSGVARMVNICPDRGGEAALDLIAYVREQGVIPGFGHTGATGEQVVEAVRRGLRYCVHFLNGPISGSYKPFHGAGAIEAVLRSREIYAELIVDGVHVLPAYVRDVIRRKGTDRVMAVTDQMFATDAKEIVEFTISGVRGRVSPDRQYVHLADNPSTLFSSVLQMQVGFGNVLSMLTQEMEGVWSERHEALSLDRALVETSRLFSGTAAEMLEIEDEVGRIEPGQRADLILVRIEGSAGCYSAEVKRTYVAGHCVA